MFTVDFPTEIKAATVVSSCDGYSAAWYILLFCGLCNTLSMWRSWGTRSCSPRPKNERYQRKGSATPFCSKGMQEQVLDTRWYHILGRTCYFVMTHLKI